MVHIPDWVHPFSNRMNVEMKVSSKNDKNHKADCQPKFYMVGRISFAQTRVFVRMLKAQLVINPNLVKLRKPVELVNRVDSTNSSKHRVTSNRHHFQQI
ncbi:unnamed protein product [Linum tenue]|uniref:Uncharacterized protein n=2 Tax=Linum tenue TaxID=586396 RepID=A0AAV0RZZ0_9ROSI|nr:unnamed protein product [Linum tenue]